MGAGVCVGNAVLNTSMNDNGKAYIYTHTTYCVNIGILFCLWVAIQIGNIIPLKSSYMHFFSRKMVQSNTSVCHTRFYNQFCESFTHTLARLPILPTAQSYIEFLLILDICMHLLHNSYKTGIKNMRDRKLTCNCSVFNVSTVYSRCAWFVTSASSRLGRV